MITANAGRYPISAQCEILGVPRATYYSMRGRREKPKQPDPLTPEVVLAYGANRRAYGARKIKAALERRRFCASRRRIGRTMRENGLASAYSKAKFKAHADRPNEAELPNIVAREFDNIAIDDLLGAFGIERSLSRKNCPYDNSVDESTNKILEGRVRLQGELLDVARAAGQAERLRPLVQPFQAAPEARLRESG